MCHRLVLAAYVLLGAAASFRIAESATTRPADRYAFAAAMAKVEKGMPAAEVKAILGEPDDIRTETDPGGVGGWVDTKEIWRYGTDGHLTCATLGAIFIDTKLTAQYVHGGRGEPPPPGMFLEPQLRRLLRAIDEAPSPSGYMFDPRKLIVAVNELQPLGKEKALAALKEYLRISERFDDREQNVFLVLRALFDVPDDPGYMPEMRIGASFPAPPKDLRQLPRFPLVIVGDAPFMLVHGYTLGGFPQPPSDHVEYFQKHGRLRAKPLVPSDRPMDLYEKLFKATTAIDLNLGEAVADDWISRAHHRMLAEQLLRLMDTVYRPPTERGKEKFALIEPDFEAGWKKIQADAARTAVRWDGKTNRYVFAKDGSTLPERPNKLYRRFIWRPELPGRNYEVGVERSDEHRVDVWLTFSTPEPRPPAQLRLYVSDPARPKEEQLAAELPWGQDSGQKTATAVSVPEQKASTTFSMRVDLPEGWQARLEIQAGDAKEQSDAWTP